MQEDYLHYLWKFQKWKNISLTTSEGFPITILNTGTHNFLSGPDFFNSRIVIGKQQWAGNVEIHIRASDWYRHAHHEDPAYDSVILHVVWEHDSEVYRKNDTVIPVLELKNFVQKDALVRYEDLLAKDQKWINCERDFPSIDDFVIENWLERLYVERLEKKSAVIEELLNRSSGDWEEVLFKMLAKNFGLNINGDAFLSTADSIPFSVVRKCMKERTGFEAILFGQSGLLEDGHEEPYFHSLRRKYEFLQNKFSLKKAEIPVKYFRLRPDNFPEIRFSQLAGIYESRSGLFSDINEAEEIDELRNILKTEASEFWKTHYTFAKPHSERRKPVSTAFTDLLIINTIIPLKFLYYKKVGVADKEEVMLGIMRKLKVESNVVVNGFNSIRPKTGITALHSQALLRLKKEYCDNNRCLHCSLGLKILKEQPRI
ncbi:DUF2851 family protein [Salinimicrobium gaetbulicola]|uniref:DUF2851 family protein n=1 Tax=Salinimicrobium gaetbulicola TaxID=999702 RepID=A0ABW3IE40_9FLAO